MKGKLTQEVTDESMGSVLQDALGTKEHSGRVRGQSKYSSSCNSVSHPSNSTDEVTFPSHIIHNKIIIFN